MFSCKPQPSFSPPAASNHLRTFCAQQVQYIAQHLSSLLLLPEVRQGLTKLPPALLLQLLSCEALEVDQVRWLGGPQMSAVTIMKLLRQV